MNKSRENAPIVVLGAGIIGLLSAWYLTKIGRVVVVVERQIVGRESSWAGGGILSPLYPRRYPSLRPLVRHSGNLYRELVNELAEISPLDPELIPSGLLILDPDEPQIRGHDQEGDVVSTARLRGLEPNLRACPDGALYYPAVSQIRAPRLIASLRAGLSKRGVVFQEQQTVTGFRVSGKRLQGVETSRGLLETTTCVVAVGAWTGSQLRSTGLELPIEPVRGQMIVIKADPDQLRHIIVYQYRYLIPRRDGRILVGSTVEKVGYDKTTTRQAHDLLQTAALTLVPGLAKYPVEHHWAGLRPGTPDDIPYIGEHPEISGLFVCAGHHRNGFATGPASAQLVVDLMFGRPPALDPTPYRLDRPAAAWSD